jgi:hypothetical protein
LVQALVLFKEPSGCVVPLSTLTFELDGGQLSPLVADWEQ